MKKLEKTKANPLDQVNKRIEKYVELYDSPVIHDPMTNTFKTEKQMVHDENKRIVDTLNKYEDGANIPEQVIKYSPKKVPNHIKDKMIEQYLTRDKDTSKRTKPDPKAFIKQKVKKVVAMEHKLWHMNWKFRYVSRLLRKVAPHLAQSEEELDEKIRKNES